MTGLESLATSINPENVHDVYSGFWQLVCLAQVAIGGLILVQWLTRHRRR